MAAPVATSQASMAPTKQKWYLGGIASACAAICTHPLDTLKVELWSCMQTSTVYTVWMSCRVYFILPLIIVGVTGILTFT